MKPTLTADMQDVIEILRNPKGVDGLLGAAQERLQFLGDGGFAEVYEHPDDPSKVIRVSIVDTDLRYPHDGWFGYAEHCRRRAQGSPFAPRLFDLVHMGRAGAGVWIAISERLEELGPTDHDLLDVMGAVQRMQYPGTYGEPELGDEEMMERLQPGLHSFLRKHCAGMEDFHIDNIMKRGDTMVINDPTCHVPPGVFRSLEKLYTAKGRPRATADIVPTAPAMGA